MYVRGDSEGNLTVLEYTPNHDQWTALPLPPVEYCTIATLRDQLLVVGGMDKSTDRKTKTIFIFNEHSGQWVRSYPAMPTALSFPAVIGYQDNLVVAGGRDLVNDWVPDVTILDTTCNRWTVAQPLPSAGYYYTVLIEDTMYLVDVDTQTVLRAHVPTLISRAKSGVWETLPNTPYYLSVPVSIGNTLLTVGGNDKGGNPTASIQVYNPTTNQWTRVGDLPVTMDDCFCAVLLGKLFVFNNHMYVGELSAGK